VFIGIPRPKFPWGEMLRELSLSRVFTFKYIFIDSPCGSQTTSDQLVFARHGIFSANSFLMIFFQITKNETCLILREVISLVTGNNKFFRFHSTFNHVRDCHRSLSSKKMVCLYTYIRICNRKLDSTKNEFPIHHELRYLSLNKSLPFNSSEISSFNC